MLIELSMVEQRYLAVREVLDTGASITQVASQYGVDRRTLHRWLIRYANGGLEALANRSSRPDSSPSQMNPRIEARGDDAPSAHGLGTTDAAHEVGERICRTCAKSFGGLSRAGASPHSNSVGCARAIQRAL